MERIFGTSAFGSNPASRKLGWSGGGAVRRCRGGEGGGIGADGGIR